VTSSSCKAGLRLWVQAPLWAMLLSQPKQQILPGKQLFGQHEHIILLTLGNIDWLKGHLLSYSKVTHVTCHITPKLSIFGQKDKGPFRAQAVSCKYLAGPRKTQDTCKIQYLVSRDTGKTKSWCLAGPISHFYLRYYLQGSCQFQPTRDTENLLYLNRR
jgi:hypothetical protein